MHRLLTDKISILDESGMLSKAAAKHLKVLRPEEGEQIELFDGAGLSRVFIYQSGRLVAKEGVVMSERKKPSITLFACVTKGSRWDWTIEKATELGITRIVPVISERTIVRIANTDRAAKRERWLRVAEDAARQSDSKWIPEIVEPIDFKSSLELVKESKCFVGALMEARTKTLIEAIMNSGEASDYSVYIGPEGDFTPDELASLIKIATPTSFGETVLRAETAAIYALSILVAIKHK